MPKVRAWFVFPPPAGGGGAVSLPMRYMRRHCFDVLIAPIGCVAHVVATRDLTLSRLRLVPDCLSAYSLF